MLRALCGDYQNLWVTRMYPSRMRTARFSDRLYRGAGWGYLPLGPGGGLFASGSRGVSTTPPSPRTPHFTTHPFHHTPCTTSPMNRMTARHV